MELGPQNHNGDGLLGANSIIVVYMDPLGYQVFDTSTHSSCTRGNLLRNLCCLILVWGGFKVIWPRAIRENDVHRAELSVLQVFERTTVLQYIPERSQIADA